MLQLLQMVEGYEPSRSRRRLGRAEPVAGGPEMVRFEAGEVSIGAGAERLRLRQRAPATHGRAGAVRDRPRPGQQRRLRRASSRRRAPSRRCTGSADGEGGWVDTAMGRAAELDPGAVVVHVDYAQAAGVRRVGGQAPADRVRVGGRGRRAPTRSAPTSTISPSAPPRPAPTATRRPDSGAVQMLGDVWEWTSSDFTAYPRLRGLPLRRVLQGLLRPRAQGAARRRLGDPAAASIRTSFRNWDLPERRQIFSGLRCARDALDARSGRRARPLRSRSTSACRPAARSRAWPPTSAPA